MKKIIMAAGALSSILICSSGFALGEKPTGLYLKGFTDQALSQHFNPSMYGVGLGYKFGLFRAEGQYSYGKRSSGNYTFISTHRHNASVLGYLDLDNRTIFSPYIGLGFGYSDYSSSLFHLSEPSFRMHGPALVGAIGSRVYLNQNLALDLGYKTSLGSNPNSSAKKGNAALGLTFHF